MIRSTLLALVLALFAGAAAAGSCPLRMGNIDQALASGEHASLSEMEMKQVKELRDKGEMLHKNGQHGASVEALMKAERMLGIAQ